MADSRRPGLARRVFKRLAIAMAVLCGLCVLLVIIMIEIAYAERLLTEYRAKIVSDTVAAMKRDGVVIREGAKP